MTDDGLHLAPYSARVAVDWLRTDADTRWKPVDGALVFVDVSGFTAMSERLASLGREGAERVTAIINDAFEALLEKAYDLDGSLLKFGGDALLILFQGEAAATRAARAAYDMRERLVEVGRVETPAGAVQLKMSAGVHAGPIDLFLVGNSHRELIVTGPAASAVVAAEGSAGAGRIVVSPGAASQLDPAVVGRRRGPGFLLTSPPEVGQRELVIRPKHSADFGHLISTSLRAHLSDSSRDEAEHRRAAVGFIHFEGTDELVTEHGGAVAGDRLHELMTAIQDAADRHQVCVLASDVDEDGGKIILTAGVPLSAGNDADRMLLTLREVVEHDPAIELRVGAHIGQLFAGEVGPRYRRTYTVMGDVVNTAARVMSRAEPGQVLASAELLEQVVTPFELTAVEPFTVKGKRHPLRASVVGRALETGASDDELDEPPLVELASEIDTVREAIRQSLQGQGSHLAITGAVGSGKTRLYREALRSFPDIDPVIIRGYRARQHVAYGPLQRALRLVLDYRPDLPESVIVPIREALATPSADNQPTGDAQRFRRRLHGAVEELFAEMFPNGVVLIVDDYQWLDEASRSLFHDLVGATRRRGWAAISTVNETDQPPDCEIDHTIRLRPLDDRAAEELVRSWTPRPLLPATVQAIVQRGMGNPAFLCELARSADDDSDLPESVEAVLSSHIDRLAPGERSLLRQLSVFGSSFELDDAAEFLQIDGGLAKRLESLRGFLEVSNGVVLFRQNLVHEVAYAGLPYARRRELHAAYGRHLEQTLEDRLAAADILAGHFWAANDDHRCLEYAAIAGRTAAARYAYEDAALYLRRAAESARRVGASDETQALLLRDLASYLNLGGHPDQAREPLRAARRLLGAHGDVAAHLHLLEGEARRTVGEFNAAVRWYMKGIRIADQAGESARSVKARMLMGLAIIRKDRGDITKSIALLHEALAVAKQANDPLPEGQASLWLLQILSVARDPAARDHGKHALEIFEQNDFLREAAQTRSALGNTEFRDGNWAKAVEHYDEARRALIELGDAIGSAVTAHNSGEILIDQGRFSLAAERLRFAADTFEAAGHPYRWMATTSLARALLVLGDPGASQTHASALAEIEGLGLHDYVAGERVAWADVATWLGLPADIPDEGEVSDDFAIRLLRVQARLKLAEGAIDAAAELAAQALDRARALDDAHQTALALAIVAAVQEANGEDPAAARLGAEAAFSELGVIAAPMWRAIPESAVA